MLNDENPRQTDTPGQGASVGRRLGDQHHSSAVRRIITLQRAVRSVGLGLRYRLRNLLSRQPITGSADCVVSVTSYGERVRQAFLSLESIGNGSERPKHLVLWLGDSDATRHLPSNLRRLVRRGLTIRYSNDYGPHTKYYPYVCASADYEAPLVTADDDIFYPHDWLSTLIARHHAEPDLIHCLRAHVCELDATRMGPYHSWRECNTTEPSLRNFATGVSGVLYPHQMVKLLAEAGDDFMIVAPTADDIWLHAVAVAAGVATSQAGTKPRNFLVTPNSQRTALAKINVVGRANDAQIGRVYSDDHVMAMCADQLCETPSPNDG